MKKKLVVTILLMAASYFFLAVEMPLLDGLSVKVFYTPMLIRQTILPFGCAFAAGILSCVMLIDYMGKLTDALLTKRIGGGRFWLGVSPIVMLAGMMMYFVREINLHSWATREWVAGSANHWSRPIVAFACAYAILPLAVLWALCKLFWLQMFPRIWVKLWKK